MTLIYDGFWLPSKIRQEILTPGTLWITQHYGAGQPKDSAGPGTVSARWPILTQKQWDQLINLLDERRNPPPPEFFDRLRAAFSTLSQRFTNLNDPLTQAALSAIPAYTGYAPEMIQFVLGALDLMPLSTLSELVTLNIPIAVQHQYISLQDLGNLKGRVRFYPTRPAFRLRRLFPYPPNKSFPLMPHHPRRVLGFAAGNVMGTAHLIALLAQVSALIHTKTAADRRKIPTILVRNSRQEPIFAPLIFSALEEIDPQLTASLAVMVWDYDDIQLQKSLVAKADLVLAAAADFTIDQIEQVIKEVQTPTHPIRFHPHGHKVSFTTIGESYLRKEMPITDLAEVEMIHLTTLLAAMDSIFWDQYGCLSSRVHFVETGNPGTYSPWEYGNILVKKIRLLSGFLPRGAIPLHGLHNRFEKYAAIEHTGMVKRCSNYEDDFLVIVDERPWSASMFQDVVNDCVERTIVIRPVKDLMEIPQTYLRWLPAKNLQTMITAIDGQGCTSWSPAFTRFVDAIGKRGVTGVRTIGRGAFPQLAYSWDGYLPLDLSLVRAPGYFTTAEFENAYQEILNTYKLYAIRGGLGL
jgi:hypothetical protein